MGRVVMYLDFYLTGTVTFEENYDLIPILQALTPVPVPDSTGGSATGVNFSSGRVLIWLYLSNFVF